jgi:hypothetical protein
MIREEGTDRPLTGADYPWLCTGCRLAVDQCAAAVPDGEDTDDPEAACNLAYDLRMFCGPGGMRCTDAPIEWVRSRMVEMAVDDDDVFECPSCGRLSAFAPDVADQLSIPTVGACSAWEVTCGHCRTPFAEAGAPIVCEAYGFRGAREAA